MAKIGYVIMKVEAFDDGIVDGAVQIKLKNTEIKTIGPVMKCRIFVFSRWAWVKAVTRTFCASLPDWLRRA